MITTTTVIEPLQEQTLFQPEEDIQHRPRFIAGRNQAIRLSHMNVTPFRGFAAFCETGHKWLTGAVALVCSCCGATDELGVILPHTPDIHTGDRYV